MTEMVHLNLDGLITDLFEWLEQVVECSHQQNGGDQKADQKPARQLAHPPPQLVISLAGVTHYF